MTLGERQCDFTSAVAKLVAFANGRGLRVKVQEWNRLLETQLRYVQEKKAKTTDSRHLDLLAVDLVIIKDGRALNTGAPADNEEYRPLGEYWESLGGRWGGRFVDKGEFKFKNNRPFDPARDIGWDPCHFEFTKAGVV